jgi:hypothetical protein
LGIYDKVWQTNIVIFSQLTRPGVPGGADTTDTLFHRMEKWVTDIEEVVAFTMDRVTTFMRERGLLPSDERKAGENVVLRNTVNNPV